MPPPQTFSQEDLVDAAALHRDLLLLVEVGLQAIERPGAKRQAEILGGGQGGGDDRGAVLGRVSRGAPGPRLILEAVDPLVVPAMDPGVDRGPRDAEVLSDLAGPSPVGDGQEDLSPFDKTGLGGARRRQLLEGLAFLRSKFAERDFGEDHECTSLRTRATPVLRQTARVSSLAG